jgi:hypothetical protein
MHPFIMYQEAKERQKDLLREAEQDRLVRLARAGRPSAIARFRQTMGGVLIKIGGKLQTRPAPQTPRILEWAER